MPSRLGVGFILLFWLATTAHVVYHDVWPRLVSDAPPPIQIDLTDEAAQVSPTRWRVYRGDEQVGSLSTKTEYLAADDTFRFTNTFQRLKLESVGLENPFGPRRAGRLELGLGARAIRDLLVEARKRAFGPVALEVVDAAKPVVRLRGRRGLLRRGKQRLLRRLRSHREPVGLALIQERLESGSRGLCRQGTR